LAKIIGTSREKIVEEVERLLDDPGLYQEMTDNLNPYGDGRASERIVNALSRWAKDKKPLMPPEEEFSPTRH